MVHSLLSGHYFWAVFRIPPAFLYLFEDIHCLVSFLMWSNCKKNRYVSLVWVNIAQWSENHEQNYHRIKKLLKFRVLAEDISNMKMALYSWKVYPSRYFLWYSRIKYGFWQIGREQFSNIFRAYDISRYNNGNFLIKIET